jgi:DNA-binding beta-propeller fold protein YncE
MRLFNAYPFTKEFSTEAIYFTPPDGNYSFVLDDKVYFISSQYNLVDDDYDVLTSGEYSLITYSSVYSLVFLFNSQSGKVEAYNVDSSSVFFRSKILEIEVDGSIDYLEYNDINQTLYLGNTILDSITEYQLPYVPTEKITGDFCLDLTVDGDEVLFIEFNKLKIIDIATGDKTLPLEDRLSESFKRVEFLYVAGSRRIYLVYGNKLLEYRENLASFTFVPAGSSFDSSEVIANGGEILASFNNSQEDTGVILSSFPTENNQFGEVTDNIGYAFFRHLNDLAVDTARNYLYIANSGSNSTVVCLNRGDNYRPLSLIAVGSNPTQLTYSSLDGKIYCLCDGEVYVIDGVSVETSFSIGSNATAIESDPRRGYILVGYRNGEVEVYRSSSIVQSMTPGVGKVNEIRFFDDRGLEILVGGDSGITSCQIPSISIGFLPDQERPQIEVKTLPGSSTEKLATNGSAIAVGYSNGDIRLFSSSFGAELSSFSDKHSSLTRIVQNYKDYFFVVGSDSITLTEGTSDPSAANTSFSQSQSWKDLMIGEDRDLNKEAVVPGQSTIEFAPFEELGPDGEFSPSFDSVVSVNFVPDLLGESANSPTVRTGYFVPKMRQFPPKVDVKETFSFHRQNPEYQDSCFTAYRFDDDTETDFFFDSSGFIDITSLQNFAGGGNVGVKRLYGQFLGLVAYQNDSDRMPLVVFNGQAITTPLGDLSMLFGFTSPPSYLKVDSTEQLNLNNTLRLSLFAGIGEKEVGSQTLLTKGNYSLREFEGELTWEVKPGRATDFSRQDRVGREVTSLIGSGSTLFALSKEENKVYSYRGQNWDKGYLLESYPIDGDSGSFNGEDSVIAVACKDGHSVYYSEDKGSSWSKLNGLIGRSPVSIRVYNNDQDQDVIYAVCFDFNSVYSFSQGKWSRNPLLEEEVGENPTDIIEFDKGTGSKFYVACSGEDRIKVSSIGGWLPSGEGKVGKYPISLESHDSDLYTVCRDSQNLWKLEGINWQRKGVVPGEGMNRLTVKDDTVYALFSTSSSIATVSRTSWDGTFAQDPEVGSDPFDLEMDDSGDIHVISRSDGNVYNLVNGEWKFDTNLSSTAEPESIINYSGDLFVAAAGNNSVYVKEKGSSQWNKQGSALEADFGPNPRGFHVLDSKLYLVCDDGLFFTDGSKDGNGRLIWQRDTDFPEDKTVVAVSQYKGSLVALTTQDIFLKDSNTGDWYSISDKNEEDSVFGGDPVDVIELNDVLYVLFTYPSDDKVWTKLITYSPGWVEVIGNSENSPSVEGGAHSLAKKDGNIWIATSDRIYLWETVGRLSIVGELDDYPFQILDHPKSGKLFALCSNGKIFSYDANSDFWTDWTESFLESPLGKGVVYNDSLYFPQGEDVFKLDWDDASSPPVSYTPVGTSVGSNIKVVGENDGTLYAATEDERLIAYNTSIEDWERVSNFGIDPSSMSSFEGNLVVACSNTNDVLMWDGSEVSRLDECGYHPYLAAFYENQLFVFCYGLDHSDPQPLGRGIYKYDGSNWVIAEVDTSIGDFIPNEQDLSLIGMTVDDLLEADKTTATIRSNPSDPNSNTLPSLYVTTVDRVCYYNSLFGIWKVLTTPGQSKLSDIASYPSSDNTIDGTDYNPSLYILSRLNNVVYKYDIYTEETPEPISEPSSEIIGMEVYEDRLHRMLIDGTVQSYDRYQTSPSWVPEVGISSASDPVVLKSFNRKLFSATRNGEIFVFPSYPPGVSLSERLVKEGESLNSNDYQALTVELSQDTYLYTNDFFASKKRPPEEIEPNDFPLYIGVGITFSSDGSIGIQDDYLFGNIADIHLSIPNGSEYDLNLSHGALYSHHVASSSYYLFEKTEDSIIKVPNNGPPYEGSILPSPIRDVDKAYYDDRHGFLIILSDNQFHLVGTNGVILKSAEIEGIKFIEIDNDFVVLNSINETYFLGESLSYSFTPSFGSIATSGKETVGLETITSYGATITRPDPKIDRRVVWKFNSRFAAGAELHFRFEGFKVYIYDRDWNLINPSGKAQTLEFDKIEVAHFYEATDDNQLENHQIFVFGREYDEDEEELVPKLQVYEFTTKLNPLNESEFNFQPFYSPVTVPPNNEVWFIEWSEQSGGAIVIISSTKQDGTRRLGRIEDLEGEFSKNDRLAYDSIRELVVATNLTRQTIAEFSLKGNLVREFPISRYPIESLGGTNKAADRVPIGIDVSMRDGYLYCLTKPSISSQLLRNEVLIFDNGKLLDSITISPKYGIAEDLYYSSELSAVVAKVENFVLCYQERILVRVIFSASADQLDLGSCVDNLSSAFIDTSWNLFSLEDSLKNWFNATSASSVILSTSGIERWQDIKSSAILTQKDQDIKPSYLDTNRINFEETQTLDLQLSVELKFDVYLLGNWADTRFVLELDGSDPIIYSELLNITSTSSGSLGEKEWLIEKVEEDYYRISIEFPYQQVFQVSIKSDPGRTFGIDNLEISDGAQRLLLKETFEDSISGWSNATQNQTGDLTTYLQPQDPLQGTSKEFNLPPAQDNSVFRSDLLTLGLDIDNSDRSIQRIIDTEPYSLDYEDETLELTWRGEVNGFFSMTGTKDKPTCLYKYNGQLYLTLADKSQVWRYEGSPKKWKVHTENNGDRPLDLMKYDGDLYCCYSRSNKVSVIEGPNKDFTWTDHLHPHRMIVFTDNGAESLYVTFQGSDEVGRYNPTDGWSFVQVGNKPSEIVEVSEGGNTYLLVSCSGSDEIWRYDGAITSNGDMDPEDWRVEFDSSQLGENSSPRGLYFSPLTQILHIACSWSNKVFRYDYELNENNFSEDSFPGEYPINFATAGEKEDERLYVVGRNYVYAIDNKTDTEWFTKDRYEVDHPYRIQVIDPPEDVERTEKGINPNYIFYTLCHNHDGDLYFAWSEEAWWGRGYTPAGDRFVPTYQIGEPLKEFKGTLFVGSNQEDNLIKSASYVLYFDGIHWSIALNLATKRYPVEGSELPRGNYRRVASFEISGFNNKLYAASNDGFIFSTSDGESWALERGTDLFDPVIVHADIGLVALDRATQELYHMPTPQWGIGQGFFVRANKPAGMGHISDILANQDCWIGIWDEETDIKMWRYYGGDSFNEHLEQGKSDEKGDGNYGKGIYRFSEVNPNNFNSEGRNNQWEYIAYYGESEDKLRILHGGYAGGWYYEQPEHPYIDRPVSSVRTSDNEIWTVSASEQRLYSMDDPSGTNFQQRASFSGNREPHYITVFEDGSGNGEEIYILVDNNYDTELWRWNSSSRQNNSEQLVQIPFNAAGSFSHVKHNNLIPWKGHLYFTESHQHRTNCRIKYYNHDEGVQDAIIQNEGPKFSFGAAVRYYRWDIDKAGLLFFQGGNLLKLDIFYYPGEDNEEEEDSHYGQFVDNYFNLYNPKLYYADQTPDIDGQYPVVFWLVRDHFFKNTEGTRIYYVWKRSNDLEFALLTADRDERGWNGINHDLMELYSLDNLNKGIIGAVVYKGYIYFLQYNSDTRMYRLYDENKNEVFSIERNNDTGVEYLSFAIGDVPELEKGEPQLWIQPSGEDRGRYGVEWGPQSPFLYYSTDPSSGFTEVETNIGEEPLGGRILEFHNGSLYRLSVNRTPEVEDLGILQKYKPDKDNPQKEGYWEDYGLFGSRRKVRTQDGRKPDSNYYKLASISNELYILDSTSFGFDYWPSEVRKLHLNDERVWRRTVEFPKPNDNLFSIDTADIRRPALIVNKDRYEIDARGAESVKNQFTPNVGTSFRGSIYGILSTDYRIPNQPLFLQDYFSQLYGLNTRTPTDQVPEFLLMGRNFRVRDLLASALGIDFDHVAFNGRQLKQVVENAENMSTILVVAEHIIVEREIEVKQGIKIVAPKKFGATIERSSEVRDFHIFRGTSPGESSLFLENLTLKEGRSNDGSYSKGTGITNFGEDSIVVLINCRIPDSIGGRRNAGFFVGSRSYLILINSYIESGDIAGGLNDCALFLYNCLFPNKVSLGHHYDSDSSNFIFNCLFAGTESMKGTFRTDRHTFYIGNTATSQNLQLSSDETVRLIAPNFYEEDDNMSTEFVYERGDPTIETPVSPIEVGNLSSLLEEETISIEKEDKSYYLFSGGSQYGNILKPKEESPLIESGDPNLIPGDVYSYIDGIHGGVSNSNQFDIDPEVLQKDMIGNSRLTNGRIDIGPIQSQ